MSEAHRATHARSSGRASRAVLVVLAGATVVLTLWSVRTRRGSQQMKPAAPEISIFSLERREGVLFRRGASEPYNGWAIERYPGGALKSRSSISNGLLEGISEGYFTNGAVQVREFFARSVADGQRRTWAIDGQILSEGTLEQGKQEGVFRKWHDNGQLAIEASFHKGQPDGPSLAWYPSGYLKAEAIMREGEVVKRLYYEDSQLRTPTLFAVTNEPAVRK